MKTRAADVSVACPSCNGARCQKTVVTQRGAYYRCGECGHMWHVDRSPTDERPANSPARRKSDRVQ